MSENDAANRTGMGEPIEWLERAEVGEQGFRSEAEREFLTALFAHVPDWAGLGVTEERCLINYWNSALMIAFDICDRNAKVVLRSLTVDFNGTNVLFGEASTNLFDSKFEIGSARIKEHYKSDSPKELAELAADWVCREMSRFPSSFHR